MANHKDSEPRRDVLTRSKILDRVAERYRSEGYEVTLAADTGVLPIEIDHARKDVALIAHKGDEWVAIDVKRRDEPYEINPLALAIEEMCPEWRYDLVVYPPDGVDEIPLEDGEPDSDYIESLLKAAQELLDAGKLRASFLMAWSASESTMRTSGRRENLEIGNGDPRFVLKTLYGNGVVSFDVYDRLGRCLSYRNRLVHGLPVNNLEPGDVRFMIESARHLLCPATAAAEA